MKDEPDRVGAGLDGRGDSILACLAADLDQEAHAAILPAASIVRITPAGSRAVISALPTSASS